MKDRKLGGIGEMAIPLLADNGHRISKAYNCLIDDPTNENDGIPLRATYIIDDKGKLRHMQVNDLPVGRNVPEILRLVEAF